MCSVCLAAFTNPVSVRFLPVVAHRCGEFTVTLVECLVLYIISRCLQIH